MDERAQSDEAGVLRYLAGWARLVIAETFAPEQQRLEGRTVGEVAAEWGMDPWDALCRVLVSRRPAHRIRRAHPRVRRGLEGPGRGVARPPGRGGRLRRRCPPRHHVRGRLLHLTPRRRGAEASAAAHRGGGPPADRRARPPLRTHRPGPSRRGVVGRPGGPRPRADRSRVRCAPVTICPEGPVVCTPRPPASSTSWSTAPRWSPATGSPGPCPGGSCARAPTPGRRPSSTAAADGPPADRVGTPEKICRSCRSGRGPFDVPVRGRDRPCPPNRGVSHAALPLA